MEEELVGDGHRPTEDEVFVKNDEIAIQQDTDHIESGDMSATQKKSVSGTSPKTGSAQRTRSKSPPKSPGRKNTAKKGKKKTTISTPTEKNSWKVVDFSYQGITAIPNNIFSKKEVSELLLPSNNIRSLPTDMRKLRNLTKLDISRNGIRCTGPNDYGGMPSEMEMLTKLETLIMAECNFRYIPPVVWKLQSLLYLDISRNKINALSPDVGNLYKLRRLNCQETNISTLPPEIVYCDDLEELLLWGNSIETLPETMVEMTNLETLAINAQGFTQLVDSYMETLLQKGQIQSEHVPAVLFEIPKLKKLDLENTMINNIPSSANRTLRELYLNGNFFSEIPTAVLNMAALAVLEISDNYLKAIPHEIQLATGLKSLKMNNNQIEKLPKAVCSMTSLGVLELGGNRLQKLPRDIGNLRHLRKLILDRNELRILPDSTCDLANLDTLDLTANQIAELPIDMYKLSSLTTAHCYRKLFKHGLWLHLNPLTLPPEQIWKTDNPKNIYDYLKRWKILNTENLQRLKVITVGEHQCGKTSLLKSLESGKSYLTKPVVDSTEVFAQMHGQTPNKVRFSLWELGGHEAYQVTTPLFLGDKCLYMLVYDHAAFRPDKFNAAIGQWLNLITTYAPGSVVKIVGTKLDLRDEADGENFEADGGNFEADGKRFEADGERFEADGESFEADGKSFVDTKSRIVRRMIARHLNECEDQLNETLNRILKLIDDGSDDTTTSRKQLENQRERLEYLIRNPLRVESRINLVTSIEGTAGMNALIFDLESLIIRKDLFPHNQRHVPVYWKKLQSRIKQHDGHFVTIERVRDYAREFNIVNADDLNHCLAHLVDMGEIIWKSDDPRLNDFVFHSPTKLAAVLACLFRHDFDEYFDFDRNRVFTCKGLYDDYNDFTKAKDDVFTHGEIPRPILRCLWFYLRLREERFVELLDILSSLRCAYVVPQPTITTPTSYREPLVVLPWYNTDVQPENLDEFWPANTGESEARVEFVFPIEFLHGVFERMSVQLQEHVDARIDWQDLVYATYTGGSLLLQRGLQIDTYDLSIQIAIRGENETITVEKLKDLAEIMREMLERRPGVVWYEYYSSNNCDTHIARYLNSDLNNES
ncbi:malignant fibrous histiocytoma-amplified sequence 1 homolog [Tubulanus polymorphus]|uniref:malignant fibrous histiocytoma-amplified sequence 1 homolog n=1 Tax=Tubulanus polymorphus TaxID=672921 RepID=UPI003DA5BB66